MSDHTRYQHEIDTVDQALADLFSGMQDAETSSIDVLAEPAVDSNEAPIIRDADELEAEELIVLGEDDLEIIIEDAPNERQTPAPGYHVPAGSYGPRHAMVLMGPEDAGAAKAIGTALAQAGIPVSYQKDDMGAIGYLNKNSVDVAVIGPQFYNVADYIEKHDSRKGTLTIGVTDNGMNVDLKVDTVPEVVRWAKQGGIVKAYVEDKDAQEYRKRVEAEAPQMLAYVQGGKK